MADTFYFGDYWPRPAVGQTFTLDYGTGADGLNLKSVYSNSGDDKVFLINDYHGGQWRDQWVINYYHERGVLETADLYPKKSYQFWVDKRTTAFQTGYEIPWGGTQKIGDVIDQELRISFWKSTFFEFPTTGRQVVKFVNRYANFTTADGKNQYRDVLEVTYDQTFGDKTAGNRGWYAKDYGLIQLTWRSNGNDVGNPMVATVSFT